MMWRPPLLPLPYGSAWSELMMWRPPLLPLPYGSAWSYQLQPNHSIICTPNWQVTPGLELMRRTQTWPATPYGEYWSVALQGPFQTLMNSEWWSKVTQDTDVYPPRENIFDFARYCHPDLVKVVIVGQDPYPSSQAHGLAFSVSNGNKPRSLENILKVTKRPFSENHGNLTYWALQGVLLLNSVLTYHDAGDEDHTNDHMQLGCEKFTDAVIKYISENNKNVVFMLWGNEAQKKGKEYKNKDLRLIDRSKHCVLETSHPSPKSAKSGFRDCDHFNECNGYLEQKQAIDWSLPDGQFLFI